jgi:hypothetical protein
VVGRRSVRDFSGRGGRGGGVERASGDVVADDRVTGDIGCPCEHAEDVVEVSLPARKTVEGCRLAIVTADDVPLVDTLLKILIAPCACNPMHRIRTTVIDSR